MTKPAKQLLKFAQILLESDYPAFEQYLSDWRSLDFETFSQKYAEIIRELNCDEFDTKNCPPEKWCFQDGRGDWLNEKILRLPHYSSEKILADFAQWKGRLAWVDWTGESESGEVSGNIDKILMRHWKKHFEWDQNDFEKTIDSNNIQRGDFIVLLFKEIDRQLQTIGYKLIFFSTGDDCYRYSVLLTDQAEKLRKMKLRWNFNYASTIDSFDHSIQPPLITRLRLGAWMLFCGVVISIRMVFHEWQRKRKRRKYEQKMRRKMRKENK